MDFMFEGVCREIEKIEIAVSNKLNFQFEKEQTFIRF